MKLIGTIEIKPNFYLTDPTMVVKGIFDSNDENDVFQFKYIEIHFTEPNKKLIHSRYWEISDGVTADEFISSHDVLKQFK